MVDTIETEDLETQLHEISSAFLNAPHEPDHPAWLALVKQLEKDYKDFRSRGMRLVVVHELPPIDEFTFPVMYRRAFNFKEIQVTFDKPVKKHPLNEWIVPGVPGQTAIFSQLDGCEFNLPVKWNEIFKGMLEYYGHYLGYFGYTVEGRIAAYKKYLIRFMAAGNYAAIPALFSETIGKLAASHTQGKDISDKARIIRASF